MKKIIKPMSALLIIVMLLMSLSGCKSDSWALKIGDRTVSAAQYKASAISIKSQFLTDNGLEETDELWDQYIDTTYSSTTQQYLDAMIQSYFITYYLYAIHFDELGLELDEDTVTEIENELQTQIDRYGSEEALDTALRETGFTYDEFKDQYYNEAKKAAVILYYYGPDSTLNPTSREEMELYYNEYYTKVKHIFLSTKDDESNDLSVSEKEDVGKKAHEIYDRAIAGEDFDTLLDEYNEDPGMASNPNGYIFSSDDTSYTRVFHNAAFDMDFGEIRLVQSNLGYHIMKRYPFMTEEMQDPDVELTLIENMMSSEMSEILDQLKERIGVEYNNTVLTELSVPNIPTSTDSESSASTGEISTDDILAALGQEETEE